MRPSPDLRADSFYLLTQDHLLPLAHRHIAVISTTASQAFSMAERVETHAVILSNNLTSDKVEDDALPLSHFAPLRRNELVALQGDVKPFKRPDPAGSSASGADTTSARKGATGGFKADAKKTTKGGPPPKARQLPTTNATKMPSVPSVPNVANKVSSFGASLVS